MVTLGLSPERVKSPRRESKLIPIVVEPIERTVPGHVGVGKGSGRRAGERVVGCGAVEKGRRQRLVLPEFVVLVMRRRCVKGRVRDHPHAAPPIPKPFGSLSARHLGLLGLPIGLWKEHVPISALGNGLRRVVDPPKGLENDPYGLYVVANVGVGGTGRRPARKPHDRVPHAVQRAEYRIGAPKTPEAEDSNRSGRGHSGWRIGWGMGMRICAAGRCCRRSGSAEREPSYPAPFLSIFRGGAHKKAPTTRGVWPAR